MKTTVEKAIVEVTDDGWPKRYLYQIATRDGHQLMTRRLKKLISGDIGLIVRWGLDKHGEDRDSEHIMMMHDIRFIGMIWLRPYTLLDELIEDRLEKQRALAQLGDTSYLTRLPEITVPLHASNQQITLMIQSELQSREDIKRRLRKLDLAKRDQDYSGDYTDIPGVLAPLDDSPVSGVILPPSDDEAGGWLQP